MTLFLLIFPVWLAWERSQSPVKKWHQFQEAFTGFQADLESRVDRIGQHFDSTVSGWTSRFLVPAGPNDGDALFVFKGDSLYFWTEDKMPAPSDPSKYRSVKSEVLREKNGWYLYHGYKKGEWVIFGARLIRTENAFRNDFIHDHFYSSLGCSPNVDVVSSNTGYPVYSGEHRYLFSLDFGSYNPDPSVPGIIAFFLLLTGLICLWRFFFLFLSRISWVDKRDMLFVCLFTISVFAVRGIFFITGFPAETPRWELFGPAGYSSSWLLPSLGDFVLDVLTGMAAALVFYGRYKRFARKSAMIYHRNWPGLLITWVLVAGVFIVTSMLVENLVLNSSFSLNLKDVTALSWQSGFGILILTGLLAIQLLVILPVMDAMFRSAAQRKPTVISIFLAAGAGMAVLFLFNRTRDWPILLLFTAVSFSTVFLTDHLGRRYPVRNLLFFLCFYSLFATYLLDRANRLREREKIELLSGKLATQRNPVTEMMYESAVKRIREDRIVAGWLSGRAGEKEISTDSLAAYLKARFFNDFWKKYQIQITCCDPGMKLKIQPQGYEVGCSIYFGGIRESYGKPTQVAGLCALDYGFSREYYLGILNGRNDGLPEGAGPAIYIEFNLKSAYPDPGYPALLTEHPRSDLPNLTDYSYGLFRAGKLIRSVGFMEYKTDLRAYAAASGPAAPVKEANVVHFRYRVNDQDTLLITKRNDNLLSYATPFSYFFILFTTLTFLVSAGIAARKRRRLIPDSLKNRLQVALIALLLITMLSVGIVQIFNILRINQKKETGNLKERAYSVLVEVQHRYGANEDLDDIDRHSLEDFLVKLSNIFFSDINIYSSHGKLIASSRPQIFEEGLLSDRMNAEAFRALYAEKNSIVLHPEVIGTMRYNSAYLPFYNDRDQVLGYINLPYFARQDEAKKEIAVFLVTFINVYILLILLGVAVAVFISNYITAPLGMLAGKLSQLRVGSANEKIVWDRPDEIGQLVAEYNRMTDELASSAELLARSAREGAWRQMARQVAHEIKNPLTPIKLSAQHLERAWKDKAPDWDQRLLRFTAMLVEQIDALSRIASDFSDFARMPSAIMGPVNLTEVVQFVVSLYRDTTPIRFDFQDTAPTAWVMGDRSQLIRLFTNLVNNAVQAIGDRPGGVVGIFLERTEGDLIIHVTDNGPGIPIEQAERIFQPDFTTKTTGMGLGLAIVKGITEGMNGSIVFSPVEPSGTDFTLRFPELMKKETDETS